jgi:hypothetical protein
MNTLVVLGDGLARYLGWWAMALVRWRDPKAPMRPRRFAVLVAGMPLFLAAQVLHAVCLLLDEILFPRYRTASLAGALVITGVPRSATTFVHRTLAAGTDEYTTLTTWEALFAPSIVQRRLLRAFGWLDRRMGSPLRRCATAVTRRLASDLDDIHAVRLDAAEEDYLQLLPAGGCFVMLLAFPSASGLRQLGGFDRRVPAGRRKRLLRFYRACLQRHVYADGGNRRLLSKNAAFGSWLAGLRETLPEARFIVCLRPPEQALSSQISAVAPARRLFGVATESPAFQQVFVDLYTQALDHLAEHVPSCPLDTVAVVDSTALRRRPGRVIRAAMARLTIVETAAIAQAIDALRSGASSGHRHSVSDLALERATLRERLEPSYRRLVTLSHCVEAPS